MDGPDTVWCNRVTRFTPDWAPDDLVGAHPDQQLQQGTGHTSRGIAWKWRGQLAPSRLLVLSPDLDCPHRHDWRADECSRIVRLFCDLRIPAVRVTYVADHIKAVHKRRFDYEDCVPIWDLGYETHGFMYGIVGKLWDSMDFDPHPPELLIAEWQRWHDD